jgi:hypothetical protein
MPQDQWQDTLTDAAKTNEKNSPREIDVYGVIVHDAPDSIPDGAPSDAPPRAAAYQSFQRAATDRIE